MSERVVLVTGALAGIGRATATVFASEGASVVVSGRRDGEGRAFVAELRELGATAEYIRADVSIEDEVLALVDDTVRVFGKLDVAVNNAGFTGSPGPLTTQTLEAYNAVFDTNVRGVFFSLKHELRVMTEQRSGSIVNLSSTFGERGGAGAALYSASKHAVNGFTRPRRLRWPPRASASTPLPLALSPQAAWTASPAVRTAPPPWPRQSRLAALASQAISPTSSSSSRPTTPGSLPVRSSL
jgi:NAD(P)-dependent dehydrogenase (short-subunit alcohol dehydrogenase family)